MEVKLIVASGKHAGREIPIKVAKFFIGRAEDCHLRPGSDLVSRHHCVILVEDGTVTIRDFGSKNGTLVNDQRVEGEQTLKTGDRMTVGQLEFKVQLATEVGGKQKPEVHGVQEAAARTVESAVDDDLDLAALFGEDGPSADMDTQTIASMQAAPADADQTAESDAAEPDDAEADDQPQKAGEIAGISEMQKKKRTADTSQQAAAEALKNLFKGRG
jgi:predicted component of type VI protein secretion system